MTPKDRYGSGPCRMLQHAACCSMPRASLHYANAQQSARDDIAEPCFRMAGACVGMCMVSAYEAGFPGSAGTRL